MESDVAVSYSDVLPEHLTAARMAGLWAEIRSGASDCEAPVLTTTPREFRRHSGHAKVQKPLPGALKPAAAQLSRLLMCSPEEGNHAAG
jgi:hypothetical protein